MINQRPISSHYPIARSKFGPAADQQDRYAQMTPHRVASTHIHAHHLPASRSVNPNPLQQTPKIILDRHPLHNLGNPRN